MTIENHRKILKSILAMTRVQLETKGSFDTYAALVMTNNSTPSRATGSRLGIIVPKGDAMSSPDAKDATMQFVGEIAREQNAEAVIWVADSWMLMPDRERLKTVTGEEWERLTHDYGVRELAAQGYGRAAEVINVSVQTPIWKMLVAQEYERRGSSIVFMGEPIVFDSALGAQGSGRLLSVWGEEVTGAAQ